MRESRLVSFILVTCNQEDLVEEAVRAALAQTYSNIEFLVSDDGSVDGTAARLEKSINEVDRQNVRFFPHQKNMGWPQHLNWVLDRANGELVVIAAGDDISEPHRVELLVREFEREPQKTMLLYSDVEFIDGQGETVDSTFQNVELESLSLEEIIASNHAAIGASCAIHRQLFEYYGPLNNGTVNEDRAWPMRAALLGRISYVNRKLVRYRVGGISDRSGKLKKIGRRIQDYRQKVLDLKVASELENAEPKYTRICKSRIMKLSVQYWLTAVTIHARAIAKSLLESFGAVAQFFGGRKSQP